MLNQIPRSMDVNAIQADKSREEERAMFAQKAKQLPGTGRGPSLASRSDLTKDPVSMPKAPQGAGGDTSLQGRGGNGLSRYRSFRSK